jgi:2-keto-4-pentenoate hydratase/2-oxohepta-3-ene-1,7-dioic acid hydratase in catechol pathway
MDQPRRSFLAGSVALGACSALPDRAAGSDVMFPVPATTIPVVGSAQKFQVRRIYCVGRNYAAHSREMGSDPKREPPFFSRSRPMRFNWCRRALPSTIPIHR